MAQRRIAIVISVQGAGTAERKVRGVNRGLLEMSKAATLSAASLAKSVIQARIVSGAYTNMMRSLQFAARTVVDFDFAMKKLQAIKQLDVETTRDLEATIRQLAAVSPRTATEVANTALAMAKLGLGAEDLKGSLKGVIDLSVALDENVDSVGETIINVKNVFNKSAKDIDKVSNQLFTGFAGSALNLEKFRVAFSFAGQAAQSAGVTFEELTGLMGILSSSGIRASTIGSQLRSVFLDLSDPTSKASKAIGNMTIKTDGLVPVLQALSKAELASFEIKDKFTKRSVNVVDILAKQTEGTQALTKEIIDNNDSLEKAIAIINESVEVVRKQAISAFADLAIEFGRMITPSLISGLRFVTTQLNLIRSSVTGGSLDLTDPKQLDALEKDLKKLLVIRERFAKLREQQTGAGAFQRSGGASVAELKSLGEERAEVEDRIAIAGIRVSDNLQKQINGVIFLSAMRKQEISEASQIRMDEEARLVLIEKQKAIAKRAGLLSKEANKEFNKEIKEGLKAFKLALRGFNKESRLLANSISFLDDEIKKAIEDAKILQEEFEATFGGQIGLALIGNFESSIDSLSNALGSNLVGAIFGVKNAFVDFGEIFKGIANAIIGDIIKVTARMIILQAVTTIFGGGGGTFGASIIKAFTPNASGFSGVVRSPTAMLVGEAGPERVSISPSAKTARGGSGEGITVVINGDVFGREKFMEAVNQANEMIERRTISV